MQRALIVDLEEGATIQYAGIDWTILKQAESGALIFSSSIVEHKPFNEDDDEKNWTQCTLRGYVTEDFLKFLIEAGGNEDDLVETEIDLTTVNGDNAFGTDKCKIFLLTESQFSDNSDKIPKAAEPYWLLTAYSCEEFYVGGAYMHFVRFVRPDGSLEGCSPDGGLYGVRPAICLKQETEVDVVNSDILNKAADLMEMVGSTRPITFSAEAKALVSEISALCGNMAFVQKTKAQAEEYANGMTAEQVYLDIPAKIVNAPTVVHMNFAVYGLIPVLKEKIEEEGQT